MQLFSLCCYIRKKAMLPNFIYLITYYILYLVIIDYWTLFCSIDVGILTAGPLGPLSPFSHAHLLCRGHFKKQEKKSEMDHTGAYITKYVWKNMRLKTYAFISHSCL